MYLHIRYNIRDYNIISNTYDIVFKQSITKYLESIKHTHGFYRIRHEKKQKTNKNVAHNILIPRTTTVCVTFRFISPTAKVFVHYSTQATSITGEFNSS